MGPNSRGQDHEDKFTSPRTGRGQIFEARAETDLMNGNRDNTQYVSHLWSRVALALSDLYTNL